MRVEREKEINRDTKKGIKKKERALECGENMNKTHFQ